MARTATAQRRAEERRAAYEAGELQPAEERWCRMCDEVKPHQDFYLRFDTDTLLSHYCRECHKKDCKIRKRLKALQEDD